MDMLRIRVRGNLRVGMSVCKNLERHGLGYSCRGSRTWRRSKLIKDAFLESDGTRMVDWSRVRWMGDAWVALVEVGCLIGLGILNSEPVGWEVVLGAAMEFVKVQESKERFEEWNLTLRLPTWGLLERQILIR